MELPSHQEVEEIPIPINTSFAGGHMIHREPAPHLNHIILPVSSSAPPQPPSTAINGGGGGGLDNQEQHANTPSPYNNKKQLVKYKECLKNHAASMGGNATDGCGEFMPSGEEGSLEALICSVCDCHRNFHRKELEGGNYNNEASSMEFYTDPRRFSKKLIVGHHQKPFSSHENFGLGYHHHHATRVAPALPLPPPQHHQMIMSYHMGSGSFPSESDEQEDGGNGGGGGGGGSGGAPPPQMMMKKRHRTKFTPDQKEKMLEFAEKAGWKIQKQEESVVQQFCQEVGIKRRVLKVWMHNNKHNLAKKMIINNVAAAIDAPQNQA